MAIKAYILITTETAQTPEVIRAVRRIPGVKEANEVMGPYDIVAEVEAQELEQVTQVLRQQIRPIPGVRNTLTCMATL